MTAEDIITVSHDGEVIGGGKPGRRVVNKAGFLIHSSIHHGASLLLQARLATSAASRGTSGRHLGDSS